MLLGADDPHVRRSLFGQKIDNQSYRAEIGPHASQQRAQNAFHTVYTEL